MELSFCDLRAKEVINICDGKRLGNIIDLIFDSCTSRVIGIVVPCEKSFFSFFKSNQDIFIPYNRIRKIGRDVILVELNPINASVSAQGQSGNTPQNPSQQNYNGAIEINNAQSEINTIKNLESEYEIPIIN